MSDIVIGYLSGGWVRKEFCESLLMAILSGRNKVTAVIGLGSGPNLSDGRNSLCRQFLDEHDAPWLLMCDTDMWFPPGMLDQLADAADPDERPVLGALCLIVREMNGSDPLPTMYGFDRSEPGVIRPRQVTRWPAGTLIRVDGTGAGCLLIHRSALETVEKASHDPAAPWFRELDVGLPGQLLGEDLGFCLRCAGAGIPVHVHTGIRAGHVKTRMLI